MSSSRATFKTMFLVSDDYLREIQNNTKVVATTATPLVQSIAASAPQSSPAPPSSLPAPVQPLNQQDDDEDMRELENWSPPTTTTNTNTMSFATDNISSTDTDNNKSGTAILSTPITESMEIKDIEQKRSICPICNAEFATKEEMLKHVKVRHKRKKAFTCRLCDKDFAADHWLNRHIREVHLSSQEWRNGKKVNPMATSLLQKRRRMRGEDDDDDDDDGDSEVVTKGREDMTPTTQQSQKRKRMQNDPRDREEEAKRFREDVTSSSNQDPENLIKCKECNKIFDSFKEFNQHQLTVHSGERRANY